MTIERILIRTMIGLSVIYFLVMLTFYSPSHSFPAILFFLVFVTADLVLPRGPKREEKAWEKIISKIIIGLLIFVVLGCLVSVTLLWKMGHFGRLG